MTWSLIVDSDGNVRQVSSTAGEDLRGRTVHAMERQGDLALEIPDLERGTWSDNMPVITADLCRRIDEERETRQQTLLTPGTAKAMIYSQKAREWEAWQRVVLGRGDELSPEELTARFPAGCAEATAAGRPLADVMGDIGAAVERTNSAIYQIDAVAVLAKQAVNGCETAAAACAVVNAIAWSPAA